MSFFIAEPLLAAGDVWEVVIGAIFFILWTVGQLLGSRQEAKQKKAARPKPALEPELQPVRLDEVAGQPRDRNQGPGQGPRNQRPPNQGPRNQGPRNQEDALRSEVEDFLRRAQGKPERKPEPQPVRQARPVKTRSPRPTASAPAPIPTMRNEGVAEHVARHITTSDIAEHTRSLGEEVAESDDRLESHLHEKFDHTLGKLEHQDAPTNAAAPQDDVAAQVAAMLRSPEGMRQLIIANEILKRPEW